MSSELSDDDDSSEDFDYFRKAKLPFTLYLLEYNGFLENLAFLVALALITLFNYDWDLGIKAYPFFF